MSDTFTPGQALPGTTANTSGLGDASSLSSTYQMTRADLATKIVWDGQQTTIGQVVNQFENLPPNQVAVWEQQLVQAGLQAAGTVGDPQARTDAFNSFLRFLAYQEANGGPSGARTPLAAGQQGPVWTGMANVDANSLLQQLIAENPGAATDKRGLTAASAGVKVHLDLSNPLDVKQVGDTIAQKLIGRDLTAQEALAITNDIRAQQTASGQGELAQEQSLLQAQTAATTGQTTSGGGLVTTQAATSPEAATTQYLTQNNPGDVQAHALLNVFEAIKSKVETDAQGSGPKAAVGPMRVI